MTSPNLPARIPILDENDRLYPEQLPATPPLGWGTGASGGGGNVSSATITQLVTLTAAQYAALTPPVSTTMYLVVGVGVYVGSSAVTVGPGSTARTAAPADTATVTDAVTAVKTSAAVTETFTGADAAPWPAAWSTTPGTGGTIDLLGNQGRMLTTTAAFGPTQLAYWGGMTAVADIDVYAEVTLTTVAQNFFVTARTTGATTGTQPYDGYSALLYPSGTGYIVRRAVGGVATDLATIPYTYTSGAKMGVRLRVVGAVVMTKVWNTAAAEPAAWQYLATDPAPLLTAGRVMFTFQNGGTATARTALVDNVTVTAATGPTVLREETFTGTDGAAWSAANWTVDVNTTVGNSLTLLGNQGRMASGGTAYGAWDTAYLWNMTATQDVEAVFDITPDYTGGGDLFIAALRATGAWTGTQPYDGYWVKIYPSGTAYEVHRSVGGVDTSLANPTHAYTAGVKMRCRFRVAGAVVSVKLWTATTAEPPAWDYTGTDASPLLTAGTLLMAHINTAANQVTLIDNLTVVNLSGTASPPVGGDGVVSNGTAMPTAAFVDSGTGTNWGNPIYKEDFTVAVPSGVIWRSRDSDGGFVSSNPYDASFFSYQPIPDTAGRCYYYSEKTMWTENSLLHINCHSEVIPETGVMTPLSATYTPRFGGTGWNQFVRVQYRYRLQPNPSTNYGGVWQWIRPDKWPQNGEFDFPEGGFQDSVHGYLHRASSTPNQENIVPATPVSIQDWHIYTQQWEPAANGVDHRLRWWIDNTLILDVSGPSIGTGDMGKSFNFQSGAPGYPGPSETAHIEIDWVVAWLHPNGFL